MSNRPNVLMVLADQHNASLLGGAGHPQVLTPHLDAFAATGVRLTQAYTQNTICMPSRVSVLSGQYCHNHGSYGLSGPANFGLGNFMRHFRRHGYRTAAYGKLHLPESPRNWLADDLDEFGDSYETVDGVFGKSAYLDELERVGLRELEDSWHNHSGAYGPRTIQMDAMPSKLPYEHTQEVWCARCTGRRENEAGLGAVER
jgi:arylsulfatase A-like enzyme